MVAGCSATSASVEGQAGRSAVVTVVDGETGRPIAGARVAARRGQPSAITDRRGVAVLPGPVAAVTARAGGYPARLAGAPGGVALVRLYHPPRQSPEYGGGPARSRHLPAVSVPPPVSRPAWIFDAGTLIEFPPVVRDGLMAFGVNSGRVFALDARTGTLRWARRHRGPIASSPAIAAGRVIVTSMDGAARAYAAAGGALLWEFSTGASPIESSPLMAGGRAIFGAWNGRLYALDAATGRPAWTFQADGDIKGSAALAGDRVIVGDYAGHVHAVSARTGRRLWTYRGGQRFYGGAAVSGATAVIGDVGGEVIALDVRTGRVRWRVATGGFVYASPAIAGDGVFIGAYDGRLRRLDLRTGAERWSVGVGGRISGSATVVGDTVYTSLLYAAGQPRRTLGLDVRDGRVRYRNGDGRYSPAVAAGRMLYLVGTRKLYAHRAPGP